MLIILVIFSCIFYLTLIFYISLVNKRLETYYIDIKRSIEKIKGDIMGNIIADKIVKLNQEPIEKKEEKNSKRSESAKKMWFERKAKKKAAEQEAQQPTKATQEQN